MLSAISSDGEWEAVAADGGGQLDDQHFRPTEGRLPPPILLQASRLART